MKEVLALIEQKQQKFEQLALFSFLRDSSIDPLKRIAWAPCLAPFAMCFKDINAYALRKEPADNPIQEAINNHTYEDGTHWAWYLTDLEKLGANISLPFVETLRFLWGDETRKTRYVCYDLLAMCNLQEDPALKLVVVEALEATGAVAFSAISQLGEELEAVTGKRYRYFSAYHARVETGHIQGGLNSEGTENFLSEIQLTEAQREQAFAFVERIFSGFEACLDEQMEYAQRHTLEQPVTKMHRSRRELTGVA